MVQGEGVCWEVIQVRVHRIEGEGARGKREGVRTPLLGVAKRERAGTCSLSAVTAARGHSERQSCL